MDVFFSEYLTHTYKTFKVCIYISEYFLFSVLGCNKQKKKKKNLRTFIYILLLVGGCKSVNTFFQLNIKKYKFNLS